MVMASSRKDPENEKDTTYLKVLRKERKLIQRELPDTRVVLEHPLMKNVLTSFEITEIASMESSTPSDRAEKLIKALECKGVEQYATFLKVLKQYRPSLAEKLKQCADKFRGI